MNYIELVHNLIATACHSDKDESHMALYSDTESMQEEENGQCAICLQRICHNTV